MSLFGGEFSTSRNPQWPGSHRGDDIIILLILIGLPICFLAPLVRASWLPTLILVSFVLVPTHYIIPNPFIAGLSLSALIGIFWSVIDRWQARGGRAPIVRLMDVCLVSFALWAAWGVRYSSESRRTAAWTLALFTLVIIPYFTAKRRGVGINIISTSLPIAAGMIGIYAIVETYVFKENLFYGWIFANSAIPVVQRWSEYRATTSLGHPLLNSTFLLVGLAMAMAKSLMPSSKRYWTAIALASACGVVATGSRSGMLLIPVVALSTILICVGGKKTKFSSTNKWLAISLAGAIVASQLAPHIFSRFSSWEAQDSSNLRSSMLTQGFEAASENAIHGTGASALGPASSTYLGIAGGNFENSYIELAIGQGVLGLVLFIAILGLGVVAAIRSGAIEAAGGIVAYALSASTFNLVYGYPEALTVLGLLLATAVSGSQPVTVDSVDSTDQSSSVRVLTAQDDEVPA